MKKHLLFFPLILLTVISLTFVKPKVGFADEHTLFLSKAYCLMDANSGTIITSNN
jgi:hypothetical protein